MLHERLETVMTLLRDFFNKRPTATVLGIFRSQDFDRSGRFEFSEFAAAINQFNLRLSEDDMRLVFNFFDKDGEPPAPSDEWPRWRAAQAWDGAPRSRAGKGGRRAGGQREGEGCGREGRTGWAALRAPSPSLRTRALGGNRTSCPSSSLRRPYLARCGPSGSGQVELKEFLNELRAEPTNAWTRVGIGRMRVRAQAPREHARTPRLARRLLCALVR